jgi:osmotically-inducible protein OsmY
MFPNHFRHSYQQLSNHAADEFLRRCVQAAFADELRHQELQLLRVDVRRGVVHLYGTVDRFFTKQLARNIARRTSIRGEVVDHIEIDRRTPRQRPASKPYLLDQSIGSECEFLISVSANQLVAAVA